MSCGRTVRGEEIGPIPTTGDGNETGSSTVSSWSVDSVATFSSSSTSIQRSRGEQVELHELRLLRSVVRSIYMDSADDENESNTEDVEEAQVPAEGAEGGLRPFLPPLVSTPAPLNPVPEDDESSSSDDDFSTPQNRVSLISNSYRSGLAQSFQAQLAQELSGNDDYDISGLWPEAVDDNSVEPVSKFSRCISLLVFF